MTPIPDVPYAPVAEPRSPHLAATREIDLSPDNLQYFSRINVHRPPSTAPFLTQGPDMDEAVIDGAAEQWVKLLAGQPIEANATFAASPHSTYHGYEVLSNGQIVDHYTAWNVFRVHNEMTQGLAFTNQAAQNVFTVGYASTRPFLGRPGWFLGIILMTVSAVSATNHGGITCRLSEFPILPTQLLISYYFCLLISHCHVFSK
ncbi:hypothetical protein B0H13DRAFT_1880147 [Mycena leptocephala]|nr:hypothetical protein B0H13DRAFT_1880147 [Mycena leptocephala]